MRTVRDNCLTLVPHLRRCRIRGQWHKPVLDYDGDIVVLGSDVCVVLVCWRLHSRLSVCHVCSLRRPARRGCLDRHPPRDPHDRHARYLVLGQGGLPEIIRQVRRAAVRLARRAQGPRALQHGRALHLRGLPRPYRERRLYQLDTVDCVWRDRHRDSSRRDSSGRHHQRAHRLCDAPDSRFPARSRCEWRGRWDIDSRDARSIIPASRSAGSLVASFFTFIIAAVISGQLNPGCDNDTCPVFVIWLLTMAANGIVVSLATTILNATFVALYAETLPLLVSQGGREAVVRAASSEQPVQLPFYVVPPTAAPSQSLGRGGEPKVADNAGAVAVSVDEI